MREILESIKVGFKEHRNTCRKSGSRGSTSKHHRRLLKLVIYSFHIPCPLLVCRFMVVWFEVVALIAVSLPRLV